MSNQEIQEIITSGEVFDLIIAEQFVTDCGLALAYKLNAPTIGMTAHILMPWTYSRLGAPNNPAYVPNAIFNSGTTPHFWDKVQNAFINLGLNLYYAHIVQKENQEILNKIYPDVPQLEILGRDISLFMVNQYFPLTGSRLYGSNVVQIGGMYINQEVVEFKDEDIKTFLDNAKNGVVYISFGTVASNLSRNILDSIIKFIANTDMTFVWKIDNITDWTVPKNVLLKKWLPQPAILCHPNVMAFSSHSGMLSSTEAIHCGVPIISVPLFGDQPKNAALALENGLGITVDVRVLDENVLQQALETVLQKRFQDRAKHLSRIWKDRPMPPMETAIFWIEFVARHKGDVEMKPPTVKIYTYEYLLLDVYFFIGLLITVIVILKVYKSLHKEKFKSKSE